MFKKYISFLQYITQGANQENHLRQIHMVCKAGIDWVQLRMKDVSADEILPVARAAVSIVKSFNAVLIINDHPEIARDTNADGVHLGKNDMSPLEARKIVGQDKIIGGTANSIQDIEYLLEQGVDYIGLGPYRFTNTKKNLSPVLGLEGYSKILPYPALKKSAIPVIAIGGITVADVAGLMNTGIHGIAVSSEVQNAPDPEIVINDFKTKLAKYSLKQFL